MAIRRKARAASKLLVAETANADGVLHGAAARGVERLHVEDVDALHLAQDLEAVETGRLVEVGRDRASGGAWGKEVGFGLDLCCARMAVSWGCTRGGVIAWGEALAYPRTSSLPWKARQAWGRALLRLLQQLGVSVVFRVRLRSSTGGLTSSGDGERAGNNWCSEGSLPRQGDGRASKQHAGRHGWSGDFVRCWSC